MVIMTRYRSVEGYKVRVNTVPESGSTDFQSLIKLIIPFTFAREYLASFLAKSSTRPLKTLCSSFSHRLRVGGRPPDFLREVVGGCSANFSHKPRSDSTSLQTSSNPGLIVDVDTLLFFDFFDEEDRLDFDWLVRSRARRPRTALDCSEEKALKIFVNKCRAGILRKKSFVEISQKILRMKGSSKNSFKFQRKIPFVEISRNITQS